MEALWSTANSIAAIAVVLGLCLFSHELGHFMAAKLFDMGVYEFALGFGPALVQRKIGETVYAIRLLPLGGFVRIAGMEEDRDVPKSFYKKPRWQGFIVLCAGVFMNVVLAVAVYGAVNIFSGLPVRDSNKVIIREVMADRPAQRAQLRADDVIAGVGDSRHSTMIASVRAGSPADRMGLKEGQRIFQIGHRPISIPRELRDALLDDKAKGKKIWLLDESAADIEGRMVSVKLTERRQDQIGRAINGSGNVDRFAENFGVTFGPMDQTTIHRFISAHPGEQVRITVNRGGRILQKKITPEGQMARLEMVDDEGRVTMPHRQVGRIGVILGPPMEQTGILEGLWIALLQSLNAVIGVLMALKAMIMGQIAAEPTGPIGIMAMTAETAKIGWSAVLSLCGLISANLAVINLIPMPPFDGGQIVIGGVEGLLQRRLNERLEMAIRLVGLFLIVNVFLYLVYKDVFNLIKFGTY